MSEHSPESPSFSPPDVGELNAAIEGYDISNLFASDQNGALYRARHGTLDRDVCIKVLPPVDEENRDAYFEAFRHEARTMAKLTHSSIVKVYDFGQTGEGLNYFVMEYVEGSIFRRMLDYGQLTMDHIYGWITPICEALQYAHERDVVHCDISPPNILVTSEGEIKLANFGLSRLAGQSTSANSLLSEYSAPECFQQLFPIDYRADIYSLGILLYELLTGQPPRGPYKSVHQFVEVDERFDEIIRRAIAIDRNDRWQSALEISSRVTRIRSNDDKPTGKFKFRE
ncbi:MAG: serine/threonine-protein kinase [Verrucomicrobiota bacterium]